MKKIKRAIQDAKCLAAVGSLSILLRLMQGTIHFLGLVFLTKEERDEIQFQVDVEEAAIREAWAKSLAKEGFPVPGYEYLEDAHDEN